MKYRTVTMTDPETGERTPFERAIPETAEEIAANDERERSGEFIDRRASFGDYDSVETPPDGAPRHQRMDRPPGGPNRAQRRRRKRRP